MAVYKKSQIAALVLLVMILLGGMVALLRPDLLPIAQLQHGVKAVIGLVSGSSTVQAPEKAGTDAAPVKKLTYRLDLKTGGRVYTDNLKQSDGTFTYTTASGLVVTIPGHEVTALKSFPEGEEPRD